MNAVVLQSSAAWTLCPAATHTTETMERCLASKWTRPLIVMLFNMLSRYDSRRSGGVLFVTSKLCIKSTGYTSLAEAHAMQFVRQHTTIPVPKVYSAFEYNGRVYIAMQTVDGTMAGRNWHSRSEESKQKILSQLKSMVEQLQCLQPPAEVGVANVDGGPNL